MTAPLIVVSSMATRHILSQLCEAYQARSGRAVDLRAMGGVTAAEAVAAGEPADLVVLASGALAKLQGAGHVAGAASPLARSLIALASPEGAALPGLRTAGELRESLRGVRPVAYSTGPSGDHVKRLWAEWGFEEAALTQAPAGVPVARLIAEGAAAAGFQQLSELIGQPGVVIAGLLPEGAQKATDFVIGVAAQSADAAGARALAAFLSDPGHAAVLRDHGMEAVPQ